MMRFVVDADVRGFARRVGPFLESRIECNVMSTVLLAVLEGRYAHPAPVLAWGVADGGVVGFGRPADAAVSDDVQRTWTSPWRPSSSSSG